ncbi:MAG: hypothetical protein ACI8SR_000191 [Oceanicoccus sp.]|jgi:hypothetical protein
MQESHTIKSVQQDIDVPVFNTKKQKRPWESSRFDNQDQDPLAGFANIMDVMLVFALGLMVALLSQSDHLQSHFNVKKTVNVQQGKELLDIPENIQKQLDAADSGMQSLGTVYKDPATGKLILIGQ